MGSGSVDLGSTFGGGGVLSLNSLKGSLSLVAGSGIVITPSGSNITIASTGSGGTVTSVALTTPGVLYSVSGSPITTAGTLALSLISQTQNTVLAGPSGGSGNPSFRLLTAGDIPSLNYISGLNGDVLATGPGLVAATIAVGAVTDTKASLANKPAVAVVATTNQTLSGLPTIDGVTVAVNTLVLLTAQSTPSQNGPWQAQTAAWTRPTWYPSGGASQAFQFITTLIRLGTVYQGSTWRMTTAGAVIIDTTATTWVVTRLALGASTVSGTGNFTDVGTDGITVTGGTGAVIGTGTSISQHVADATHNGYLNASDWNTFNNKLSHSFGNYITNPDAEINTVGWNLYNNSGNTIPASVVIQDITYTSALSGSGGNGVEIEYIYNASFPAATPNINVISSSHVQVQWNNGPTVSNNPTATQLKAAWDAVGAATAIATTVITGTASKLQFITGASFLNGGGDSSPTTGTGGSPLGVTFTRNTSTPLVGTASFDLGKISSSEQGQGVSTDFVINTLDMGQKLQISFAYSGSSGMVLGSNSDVQVFVYDIINAVLIPVTPLITIAGPVSTPKMFTGIFQASASSSNYRLILHIATTNATAWDLLLDIVTVNDQITAGAATQVPALVLLNQPISGSVTDHMCVMWIDGATQWVPATSVYGNDYWSLLGFAINIAGATASVQTEGLLDGFSFGPFAGFNQYVDPANPGGLTPAPSPFTDTYLIVGKGVSATALDIQFFKGVDLIISAINTPVKGGLLSNSGANDGSGDQVLLVGGNGNVVVANSAAALGINWAPAVVAAAPFTYVTSTRTLTAATATNSVAGFLSAADHTTFAAKQSATLTSAHILVGNGSNVATDVAVTGDVSFTNAGVTSISAATVTGKLITGYVSGAGTVAATDTILQAINKLNGNALLLAPLASPTFTGDVNVSTGNLLISTIGKGLQVKTGTNAKIGTAVLVAGTATVANASITANSRIFLTSNVDGGTVGFVRVSAKTVATSFVITSSNPLDTSTIAWYIVESIP